MELKNVMRDHRIVSVTKAVAKTASLKNSGLNGIRSHDLCNTGAVLYQLSYQANWELAFRTN